MRVQVRGERVYTLVLIPLNRVVLLNGTNVILDKLCCSLNPLESGRVVK